jgi:DNA-binding ferritin-like protein
MNANIGLKESAKTKVLGVLDRTLADLSVLSQKTRNFHWNVTGPRFNDLHKFFESQYETLEDEIDETAERSRALGGRALGSMKELLARTRLKEAPAGRSPPPTRCSSSSCATTRPSSAPCAPTPTCAAEPATRAPRTSSSA